MRCAERSGRGPEHSLNCFFLKLGAPAHHLDNHAPQRSIVGSFFGDDANGRAR